MHIRRTYTCGGAPSRWPNASPRYVGIIQGSWEKQFDID